MKQVFEVVAFVTYEIGLYRYVMYLWDRKFYVNLRYKIHRWKLKAESELFLFCLPNLFK